MNSNGRGDRAPGVGFALTLLAIGAVLALTIGPLLPPTWPLAAQCASEPCKEARQWLGLAFTGMLFSAGLYQYSRAQQWKRAEFVAKEMDTFLAKPGVKKAMLMIDWSGRDINLFDNADSNTWPMVTREIQNRALLPHTIVNADGGGDQSRGDSRDGTSEVSLKGGSRYFDAREAAIRDCYDAFLDGLERFASYVDTGLVTLADLRPYLGYWISDIAESTNADKPGGKLDGEWTCILLTYIHFYKFTGVQSLFMQFGHDIRPAGTKYKEFLGQVADANRAALIKKEVYEVA